MALLTLKKGSSSNLGNVTIKDGQLIVCTDLNRIYLDSGSTRHYLGGGYGLRSDAQIIRVEGDSQTYYPVRILLGHNNNFGFTHIHISRAYSASAPDTWNTSTHRGGLTLSIRWTGDSTWGGNDKSIIVDEFNETYSKMVAGLDNSTNGLIVWLRGGGANYQLSTEYGLATTFEIHYTDYTASNGVIFSPRTDLTNVDNEIKKRWTNRNGILYSGGYITLHSNNYTSYTVTKTGGGASGTWGINVTGSSASCTGNSATATLATSVKDSGDGRTLYMNYSAAGMSSTSWLASWNGNTLQSIAPSVLKVGYASQLSAYSTVGEYTKNTLAYFNISGTAGAAVGANDTPTTAWWHILRCTHSNGSGYYTDLAIPFNDNSLYYKRISNGVLQNSGWVKVLDALNYSGVADARYLKLTGGTLSGLLTISTNGKYYQIGCANASFAHHQTDATSGHWFNKDVFVQGNIYCGSSYNTKVLTVAGDRMTGVLTRDALSTSWIDMTHGYGAIIYKDKAAANGGATACWAVKTNTGSWGCGNLSGNDNLYFVWGSDANYNAGTNSANSGIYMASNGVLYGAAWNDYAEFRIPKDKQVFEPGTCVIEVGDDTLIASTERMQAGALIVSDTFGFAIGETEECTTPIATSGRVLAIPFEPRESYLPGDPVCSGPNGTVSKMSEQEAMMYPHKMIGTVSAIPSYTHWGTGNVEVNGRIWIQIR